jgi:hypothetical protein
VVVSCKGEFISGIKRKSHERLFYRLRNRDSRFVRNDSLRPCGTPAFRQRGFALVGDRKVEDNLL